MQKFATEKIILILVMIPTITAQIVMQQQQMMQVQQVQQIQ